VPEKTIHAEAVEALASHQWGSLPDSAHRGHQFDSSCAVCRGDTEAMAAVVLRVAEKRMRAIADRFREKAPKQATLGAQWSGEEQGRQWDEVADLIARGLPIEAEAGRD
jgi:hypothetical protein